MTLVKPFDLVSGCSTGAIIAGCLACGVPISKIKELYVDTEHGKGAELFERNWLWPIHGPKFKKGPLMGEITDQCCVAANLRKSTIRMDDVLTKLQIVAVDRCSDDNIYFKSWKPKWAQLTVPEAIQRSFSAAAYFGQTNVPKKSVVYADGGQGNANCTLRECMIEAYKLGWRNEGFYILSVGTGNIDGRIPYKEASKQGNIGQTADYINMARRQALRTQINEAETVRQINPKFDYDRVDIRIDKKYDVLDGLKYTDQYIAYGKAMAHEWLIERGDYLRKKLTAAGHKILQLDGGGLRGIISAVFLDELERYLNKTLD